MTRTKLRTKTTKKYTTIEKTMTCPMCNRDVKLHIESINGIIVDAIQELQRKSISKPHAITNKEEMETAIRNFIAAYNDEENCTDVSDIQYEYDQLVKSISRRKRA